MTTVTLPPDPESVCCIALVTSSETSKVAASESTPGNCAAALRAKSRTRDTCRGSPGIVTDPKTIEPLSSRRPPAVDFIRFSLPRVLRIYMSATLNKSAARICPNCTVMAYYLDIPSTLRVQPSAIRTIMTRKFITRKCMGEILQMKSRMGFHLTLLSCIVQLVKTV
jgi:hypothetical protein